MATGSPYRLQQEVVVFLRYVVNYAVVKQMTASVIYCSLSSSGRVGSVRGLT